MRLPDSGALASNITMVRPRRPLPPVATFGQMRRHVCWTWVNCINPKCRRCRPIALTPLIIRWTADGSTDLLRQHARCTMCGQRGATLQHPSWIDIGTEWAPFPVDFFLR